MKIRHLHEDGEQPTADPHLPLLHLINAVLSVGDAAKIAKGLQRLAAMDVAQLSQLMAKAEPGTNFLQNFLSSRPSNIRKLIPIFSKFGEEATDQLIDKAMGIGEDDEYDPESDLYYSSGDDGGGC